MKHLLTTLLLATLCATGYGQTIKALGYNTSGVVIGPTNTLTFTNSITKQGEAEFGAGNAVLFFYDLDGTKDIFFFDGGDDQARARQNLGLGATWLTNTNVTNFRTAIGLGWSALTSSNPTDFYSNTLDSYAFIAAAIQEDNAAARQDLGLPLPALTNTSNVTMMRALAGSTNTNEPFSGVIQVQDLGPFDDSIQITISNGIIVKVEL